jgi:hypothetical protein
LEPILADEELIDKKIYNESWYYYLTGEWRTPFPTELKYWRAYMEVGYRFYSILPSVLHCYKCGIPMAGFWGNVFRFAGSVLASFSPGSVMGVKSPHAGMKAGWKWN